MERDELLRLLNLNETRAGPDEGPALVVSGAETREHPAGEPTALEVDAWGLRRGRDLLAESERLRGYSLDEWAVADCHAAAFDPEPRLTPACRDATRREFFAALLETPEYWSLHQAKALALALAWIARQQRRWCALVAYSGDTGERILPLPPARWNETALADWLCEFLGRGSSLDVPVREMPRIYRDLHAPIGETDVLFVTDCRCSIPESVRDAFLQLKTTVRARLLTLVLGDDAGDLNSVSDEVHCVRTLDLGEEAVAWQCATPRRRTERRRGHPVRGSRRSGTVAAHVV